MEKHMFLDALKANKILVSDGATGSNLQQRGLGHGMPGEMWVLERPQEIIKLTQEFIAAGSQIVLTSTFGATPIRLHASGLEDKIQEINLQAVSLARTAIADADVFLAASIGPLGELIEPFGNISAAEAESNFYQQAQILQQAHVDLFVIETMFDINEAQNAVRAVRRVSDKPLVVSFSYDRGTKTMMGVNPARMAAALREFEIDVLGINCGRSLEDNLNALQALKEATDKPIWFKPNAGLPTLDPQGVPVYDVQPADMAAKVPQWLAAGANIIGGCCGTTPQHVQAIAQAAKSFAQ